MRIHVLHAAVLLFGAVACGGAKTEPPAPPASPASSASSASPPPSASADPGVAATAAVDEDEVSPRAKAAAAAAKPSSAGSKAATPLAGLFDKSAKKADFPKKAASDADCWKTATMSGAAAKDYETILGKCGSPTGMKEYVAKVAGKLDDKHRADAYSVKMLGGFCYRFFAIGDGSMANIDIRVQTPKGALVSMSQSSNSAAMLDPDEPWCKTHDREFNFIVETPTGKGNYVFGVWARPK